MFVYQQNTKMSLQTKALQFARSPETKVTPRKNYELALPKNETPWILIIIVATVTVNSMTDIVVVPQGSTICVSIKHGQVPKGRGQWRYLWHVFSPFSNVGAVSLCRSQEHPQERVISTRSFSRSLPAQSSTTLYYINVSCNSIDGARFLHEKQNIAALHYYHAWTICVHFVFSRFRKAELFMPTATRTLIGRLASSWNLANTPKNYRPANHHVFLQTILGHVTLSLTYTLSCLFFPAYQAQNVISVLYFNNPRTSFAKSSKFSYSSPIH